MPSLRQFPHCRFGPARKKHSQFLTIPFGVISYAAWAMPTERGGIWVLWPKPLKITPREWFET